MTTFLLVRHGETDALGNFLAGSMPGCHLNEDGMKQVKRLAAELAEVPIKAIYTSPLERAVETAEQLAIPHELRPIQYEALSEMKFGGWEGKKFSELDKDEMWQRFNKVRSMVRPPNGELMIAVQTRMMEAADWMQLAHKDAVIALVSHADPLRALIAHVMGVALDHLRRIRIDPGSVSIVRSNGDWQEVAGLNYTGSIAI
jgi:probable phosphoglycerate mutase